MHGDGIDRRVCHDVLRTVAEFVGLRDAFDPMALVCSGFLAAARSAHSVTRRRALRRGITVLVTTMTRRAALVSTGFWFAAVCAWRDVWPAQAAWLVAVAWFVERAPPPVTDPAAAALERVMRMCGGRAAEEGWVGSLALAFGAASAALTGPCDRVMPAAALLAAFCCTALASVRVKAVGVAAVGVAALGVVIFCNVFVALFAYSALCAMPVWLLGLALNRHGVSCEATIGQVVGLVSVVLLSSQYCRTAPVERFALACAWFAVPPDGLDGPTT